MTKGDLSFNTSVSMFPSISEDLVNSLENGSLNLNPDVLADLTAEPKSILRKEDANSLRFSSSNNSLASVRLGPENPPGVHNSRTTTITDASSKETDNDEEDDKPLYENYPASSSISSLLRRSKSSLGGMVASLVSSAASGSSNNGSVGSNSMAMRELNAKISRDSVSTSSSKKSK